MFFRLLLRSATVRRGRTLTALFAMVVAATLTTALLDLYGDIGAKLSGDFRRFGANVIFTAPAGLNEEDIAALQKRLGPQAVLMPEDYAVAHTKNGAQVVVAGVDLNKARELNPYWEINPRTSAPNGVLVGAKIAGVLGDRTTLRFGSKNIEVAPTGVLHTGGDEDGRVYMPLNDFENWTGLKPTVIEAALPGTPGEVSAVIARLQSQLPRSMTVQPVRQIVEAETRVLGTSRFILLLSTLAIAITVALCVLSTLTASVLERRKDYAVMKALGSSQANVNAIFMGETVSLAVISAAIGFLAGGGLAIWIGEANFHTGITLRLSVFPYVLAGCVVIAVLSAILPLSLLQKTQPAMMLKGE